LPKTPENARTRNILSLRDETAFSLGASLTWERLLVLGAAVSATAATVAIAAVSAGSA
jgi:ABC-type Fe3+-siderophore transport system permease subunit